MKFGNLLRSTAVQLPQLDTVCRFYKQTKKQMKLCLYTADGHPPEGGPAEGAAGERWFAETVSNQVEEWNNLYIETEEMNVIRLGSLVAACDEGDLAASGWAIYRELVDFHGEQLLFMHWSILAYTAIVKLLKKHHKHTHTLVEAPQLQHLLSEPFCSTEALASMLTRTEAAILQLSARLARLGLTMPQQPHATTTTTATPHFNTASESGTAGSGSGGSNSSAVLRALVPGGTSSNDSITHPVCFDTLRQQAEQILDASEDFIESDDTDHNGDSSVTSRAAGVYVEGNTRRSGEEVGSSSRCFLESGRASRNSRHNPGRGRAVSGQISRGAGQESGDARHRGFEIGQGGSESGGGVMPVRRTRPRQGRPPSPTLSEGVVQMSQQLGAPPSHGSPATLMQQTQLAINTWALMRNTASTPSTVCGP